MKAKFRFGKTRINGRKNEVFCWVFECPYCGKDVVRPTGEGKRLTACSQSCAENLKDKKPYKGSTIISGYRYIYKPEHPNAILKGRYVAEHRLVLENKIGRLLNNDEIAHHINGNELDNRPENLELMTVYEHNSYHAKRRKRDDKNQFSEI